ncbi:MAG TPA: phospholipase D family protein [Burkholderiales bacterium]|nr:phospholipase D family protein [Burkholderiales bacterium]
MLRGAVLAAVLAAAACPPGQAAEDPMALIAAAIAAHPGKTGAYVLDTGGEALLARAWLADHARESIEVQYFIWSTDNVGILAAEALLRAAERGVRVRVIVDDLLIDAPDKSLLALARHPRIEIRVYNPKSSVGVPLYRRLLNALTDFRGVNQRMHDKTLIVDAALAITGGRNMAAEYFDYNHEYNFRDRDALLLGGAVKDVRESFEAFWASELAVPVARLYGGLPALQKSARLDEGEAARIYGELHAYARSPGNFAPQVRAAIAAMPAAFPELAKDVAWTDAQFVSDRPGKDASRLRLDGGGRSSATLAALVAEARRRVLIQSPYLVPSEEEMAILRRLVARGVKVRISTNSLASTDNLPAFSGYRSSRAELLRLGLDIYEYRPAPEEQRRLMQQLPGTTGKPPIAALHAKTLVVDSSAVFIGTFNLDPRSQNLNTEVGVIIRDERLARAVEAAIETDMAPGNSWNAARDDPDRHVALAKRAKVRLYQWLPIRPLL